MKLTLIEKIQAAYLDAKESLANNDLASALTHFDTLKDRILKLQWRTISADNRDVIWLSVEKTIELCKTHHNNTLDETITFFQNWQQRSGISKTEIHTRLGYEAERSHQHEIAEHHFKKAIDDLQQNAAIASQRPMLILQNDQTALSLIRPGMINSANELDLALAQCDKAIVNAEQLLKEAPLQVAKKLSLIYLTQGILFELVALEEQYLGRKEQFHAQTEYLRFATFAFKKSAEYCYETDPTLEAIIHQFIDNPQFIAFQRQHHADLLETLYNALYRFDSRITKEDMWKTSEIFDAKKEPLKSQLACNLAFKHVSNFAEWNLTGKEKKGCISSYIRWFKNTVLKNSETESVLKAWKPLAILLDNNEIEIEPAVLTAVQKHHVKRYPPIIDTPSIPNAPITTTPCVNEMTEEEQFYIQVTEWMDQLQDAVHNKRTSKKVAEIDIKTSTLPMMMHHIAAQMSRINHDTKKGYPDVLPYLVIILKSLNDRGIDCHLAHLKLAKFYISLEHSSKAQTIYQNIIAKYPLNVDAHLGLAEIAYRQHQFLQAIRYCETAKGIGDQTSLATINTLLEKIHLEQNEEQEKLRTIQSISQQMVISTGDLNAASKKTDVWLAKIDEHADIYFFVLCEKATLQIQRLKKENHFYIKERSSSKTDVHVINLTSLNIEMDILQTILKTLPEYVPAHFMLGYTYELYGKILKTAYDNIAPSDRNEATKYQLITAVDYFGKAAAQYTRVLEIDPNHHNARLQLANHQKSAQQYHAAIENYTLIANSDTPYVQQVRVNLAVAHSRFKNHRISFDMLQTILAEALTPGSAFHSFNKNKQSCSLATLYYLTAIAAKNLGLIDEAKDLYLRAKEHHQQQPAHDFARFKLLHVNHSTNKKLPLEALSALTHNKVPLLVNNPDGCYFYDYHAKTNTFLKPLILNTKEINDEMSKYHILIAPSTTQLLQGYFPELYYYIWSKMPKGKTITAWDSIVTEDIDQELASLKDLVVTQPIKYAVQHASHLLHAAATNTPEEVISDPTNMLPAKPGGSSY